VSAVFAPLLLLLFLEVGLRLAGVGYETDFWLPGEVEGELHSSARFGWRFLGRDMNQVPVASIVREDSGPEDYRVIVFGGSAANGWPSSHYAFSRILEVMLEETFPDTGFEVVNTAITAVNSHVVLPTVRDARRLGADLYIVYMGNNEVVGPFGAGSVIRGYQPALSLIRASIALRGTRLGQLLVEARSRLPHRDSRPVVWQGMEMFVSQQVSAADPRLEVVYDNFRANLLGIVCEARRAEADVILATLLTNLADLPPFKSASRSDLDSVELERWQALYGEGRRRAAEGRHREALSRFEDAMEIDDSHARLHYETGRAWLALGQRERARERLVRARDLDTLRFRADSRINQIIAEVARSEGVPLVDFDEGAAASRVSDIPGEELLLEHVHLTWEGNYSIAAALFEVVLPLLPDRIAGGVQSRAVPSEERCAKRLGVTPSLRFDDGLRLLTSMAERPPFDPEWQARALERWNARPEFAEFADRASAIEVLESALAERPEDLLMREVLAGQLEAAARPDEAIVHLRFILDRYSDWGWIRSRLASLLFERGEVEASIAQARRALALKPADIEARTLLANALVEKGNTDEAIAEMERVVNFDPKAASSRYRFGRFLVDVGRLARAERELDIAIELTPDNAKYHHQLALVQWTLGNRDEAIATIRRAAELAPRSGEILFYAADLTAQYGNFGTARRYYERALAVDPWLGERNPGLGRALGVATPGEQ